jgi:pyruvate dehydrogenase E1 component alpha subunit
MNAVGTIKPNARPFYQKYNAAELKEALRRMYLIRRFEEGAEEAYMRGLIHGTMHLSIGQEASAVGATMALRTSDYITSTHRGHGHCIGKGAEPKLMFAEFFGKEEGYCRGRGGSMHIADVATGNLGANGIVGGGLPIAVGAALAIRKQKRDDVAMCFFGDGASNEGAFHEALNMAALWKLPAIFIIENNRYGMGTAVERASAINDIYQRGASYDMPRAMVDGQDVFAVRAAMEEAINRARTESIPTLLEMRTYRFMGHSMSDAVSGTYRSKAELDEYLKRDPITLLRTKMEAEGQITAAEIEAMDAEIMAVVQDAWDFADASPEPPLESLYTDVLVETHS